MDSFKKIAQTRNILNFSTLKVQEAFGTFTLDHGIDVFQFKIIESTSITHGFKLHFGLNFGCSKIKL